MTKRLIVFVHGWSTTHTSTYGGLPKRISAEAARVGVDVSVSEVFLSKYVSFRDEVRVEDVATAFEAAVRTELETLVEAHGQFTAITHSTGAPALREWHRRFYVDKERSGPCPMRHLIMLAPANFGSALAIIGKGRLGRIKSFFQGVEPGTGVLNWLQLGSADSWALNEWWITSGAEHIGGDSGIFPFVITGQSIDRKLYDHLNTYTGESGSDGVIRVAAANLNATYVRLRQHSVAPGEDGALKARLRESDPVEAPRTAMRVVAGASHSGKDMGIMRSVDPRPGYRKGQEVADAIIAAMLVDTAEDYDALIPAWDAATAEVQEEERLEIEDRLLLPDSFFIHDRYSMVIARMRDSAGHSVADFDLLLTGDDHSPDRLPDGFLVDRQWNADARTLTFLFNNDVMVGSDEPVARVGREYRAPLPGANRLGMIIKPRPDEGFVHYVDSEVAATPSAVKRFLKPNQTTLVDIELERVVRRGTYELDRGFDQRGFKHSDPGDPVE